jgi:hypothetical protein
MLAWVIMGIAIWHFAIWLPDHSWGGIVGAFIGSLIGSVVIGLAIHGFSVPGTNDTHLITAIEGIPGAIIGMAIIYAEGLRRERIAGSQPPPSAGRPRRAAIR